MERINSQLSQDIKENRADFVINNSFGLEQTETQVSELIKLLKLRRFLKEHLCYQVNYIYRKR